MAEVVQLLGRLTEEQKERAKLLVQLNIASLRLADLGWKPGSDERYVWAGHFVDKAIECLKEMDRR